MNLTVDAGNSRIKWRHDSMEVAMAAGSLEQLGDQWNALGPVSIEFAAGSCVRGSDLAANIDKLAQARFGIRISWQISTARACGVTNAYPEPECLGVDRWVALIAARVLFPDQACIVVDAGTAITVDLLDATGLHRGGVILPGASSMLKALDRAEQLFPDASPNLQQRLDSVQALTDNTHDALLAGIIFAMQGGVSAVIAQQAAQISAKIEALPIIITGGDSCMLKLDGLQTFSVPDLVLDGLRVLTESCE